MIRSLYYTVMGRSNGPYDTIRYGESTGSKQPWLLTGFWFIDRCTLKVDTDCMGSILWCLLRVWELISGVYGDLWDMVFKIMCYCNGWPTQNQPTRKTTVKNVWFSSSKVHLRSSGHPRSSHRPALNWFRVKSCLFHHRVGLDRQTYYPF